MPHILDIETRPSNEEWGVHKVDAPATIDQIGIIEARPVIDPDGTVRYVRDGDPVQLRASKVGEQGIIDKMVDLINSSSGAAIVTHNKQHDLPKAIARAAELGRLDQVNILTQAFEGTHPGAINIDSMLLSQLGFPSEWSHSVQSMAIASGVRPAGWRQKHAEDVLDDAAVELDITNAAAKRARETVNWLAADEQLHPKDISGQYVWRSVGGPQERRRLYRIEGIAQSPEMAEAKSAAIILREMSLDGGKLVPGRLDAADAAEFYLWKRYGGSFVNVSPTEGKRLLTQTEEDLARGRVRSIFSSVDRPFMELRRLDAISQVGADVKRPALGAEALGMLTDVILGNKSRADIPEAIRNDIIDYGESSQLAEWLLTWGMDPRMQGQMRRMSGWLEGEFEPVHKRVYEWMRSEAFDAPTQTRLLDIYWNKTNDILGDFKRISIDVAPHARQLSINLPEIADWPIGFNISSAQKLQADIARNSERIAAHLSDRRAAEILDGYASPEELSAFIAGVGSKERMSALKSDAAQERLRSSIWNTEIFGAFKATRSDLAERMTDAKGVDALADAFTSPDRLFTRLVEIGQAKHLETWQYEMLTQREAFDYLQSRIGKKGLTTEQRAALDQAFADVQAISRANVSQEVRHNLNVLPDAPYIYRRYHGATIDQVFDRAHHDTLEEIGDATRAAEMGRGKATRFLAHLFAAQHYFDDLGEPVQREIMGRLGLIGASEAKLRAFRNGVIGTADAAQLIRSDEYSEAVREALAPIASEQAQQKIAGASSLADLAGIASPLDPMQDMPTGITELSRMAINPALTETARDNISTMVSAARAGSSAGFYSSTWAREGFAQVVEHTLGSSSKHETTAAAISKAKAFIGAIDEFPMGKVAVAAIGTAAALFLARKPNVEPDEEKMTTKQRFEHLVSTEEKPSYFKIVAKVRGMMDQETGTTDEDIIGVTKAAVSAHLDSGIKQTGHETTDSRQSFSRSRINDIASSLAKGTFLRYI